MLDLQKPYVYQGNGNVYISERNSNGETNGYLNIGRVSKVVLSIKDKIKEHFESMTNQAARDKVVSFGPDIELEMTVDHITIDNLSRFWDTIYTTIPLGLSSQVYDVKVGRTYFLGFLKCFNLTMYNLAGTKMYSQGSNYVLSGDTGMLTILEDQSEAVNPLTDQQVNISFNYDDHKILDYAKGNTTEYSLIFEGLNIAESNNPIVLQCHRVGFTVINQFKLCGSGSSNLVVKSLLMQDVTKPAGSQFFKEFLLL